MFRVAFVVLLSLFNIQANAQNSIQKLYKKVNGSVVELHVKSIAEPKLGDVNYKVSVDGSLGSGALISKEGRILTAAHVVERATEIEVIFADGTKASGHVVWVDALIDLAMIQASNVPNNIVPLSLAESENYDIGDQVVVIGAPYGVSHSLSVGYLSGIRNMGKISGSDLSPRFLQTDASINQGNSGGPMFNLKGEIIGIVSHILSKTGGSNGLGFVVSIDTINTVLDSNPATFSGFIPHLLNEQQAKAINNPYGYGLLIQQIVPNTLADRLGFRGGYINVTIGHKPFLLGGDILIAVNDHQLKTLADVVNVKQKFSDVKKGEELSFKILREGNTKEIYWTVD